MLKAKKIHTFFTAVYDRFFDTHCPNRAAALAYSTLLAIVPLMIVTFYILSFFPIFKGVGGMFQNFILDNFVADSAHGIVKYLNLFILQMRKLSWINLVALVIVSILLMVNMVRAFNIIWQVKTKRHVAFSFSIYFFVLLITPVIFGVLLLLGSHLSSLKFFLNDEWVTQPIVILLPYISQWIAFTFLNWALPHTKVKWWTALAAGLLTMALLEAAGYGFDLYVLYFSGYRLLYGALALIPIFLIWLYVSWLIILLGAAVCCCLNRANSDQ